MTEINDGRLQQLAGAMHGQGRAMAKGDEHLAAAILLGAAALAFAKSGLSSSEIDIAVDRAFSKEPSEIEPRD